MKVLIGEFITESNENIPRKNEITAYDIAFGEECVRKMHVGDIFAQAGIEVIPAVYAVSGASGVIKRHTFDYIEACFIRTVEEHLNEIDGIYMMLHGASEVEGLGSGEHHILAEVRKRVGPYVPIYVACDPHGNLCKEYVESAQVVRSYRESPHTDSIQTRRIVAGMLCEALKKRENIHAVYRKLPLILGGEQSVSADEPVKSINQYMDEMEKDPRICSASWHVGYIRHDTPVAGCGIVVTPATAADQEYAEQAADALAAYVWDKRHEFHYTGLTAEPDKALEMAMAQEKGPVFITDSGDNVTSGATGWNTYILRQVLALKDTDKTFLFASICDPQCCRGLMEAEIGEERHITLGVGHDELSAPVELDVTVKSKGEIVRNDRLHDHESVRPLRYRSCKGNGHRHRGGRQREDLLGQDHLRPRPCGLERLRHHGGQTGLYLPGAERSRSLLCDVSHGRRDTPEHPKTAVQAHPAPDVPHRRDLNKEIRE